MSKNGIDFVIGAKQNATAAMESVYRLLTRLTAATIAYKTAALSSDGLRKINDAFDEQTEAVRKLNAVLKIRGAQGQSAAMQGMAKNLEKLTGTADTATMALMHQASGMGFAAGAMDDAAKAAIGLSQATGVDAEQSMIDMKAALEGNFDAFYQINPQIMYMRSNQQKLAAVMAIANQGLEQQSQDMGTVAGSGRRADSAITTFMETVGTLVAPIRVLINAGLQQLSESFTTLLAPAAAYATSVLENIGPMMDWVKEKVVQGVNLMVGAFTWLETIVTNLGNIWDMAVATAELAMIKIVAPIAHAFHETIPTVMLWFGENFINLIRDAMVGAATLVVNHIRKIIDAWMALFEFLWSGGQTDVLGRMGEIAGRSYLEGFESSLTAFPELAVRAIGAREKELGEQIAEIGGRLGRQFFDKFSERMVGVGSELSGELSSATKNIDLKMRQEVITQGVQATQGRLLTRGPGTRIPDMMQQIINLLKNPPKPEKDKKLLVQLDPNQMKVWDTIQKQTANTVQMEAIV